MKSWPVACKLTYTYPLINRANNCIIEFYKKRKNNRKHTTTKLPETNLHEIYNSPQLSCSVLCILQHTLLKGLLAVCVVLLAISINRDLQTGNQLRKLKPSSAIHSIFIRFVEKMVGPNSGKSLRLQDIPTLCQKHCKIKDPQRVERIINELVLGGVNKLQIVSDFDYTITKQRTNNGAEVLTSFGILNACKSLPDSFVEESNKLYHKYRPIEIDPRMPVEEKVKYMIEWWTKTGNLLVGFPLDQGEIDKIAYDYKDYLRDNANELFHTLNRLNVPVLVFSAGLGNSVVSVLKHAKVMYPNVKVVSNFLQYKGDLLDGFQEPMIHTFNKNETVLKGSEYYELVHNRDHIIVMGDSIGDSGMADGVPSTSHIIKIGFLFDHVEENLEKYMNAFDIVLVDDQTMDVPRALLKIIENN